MKGTPNPHLSAPAPQSEADSAATAVSLDSIAPWKAVDAENEAPWSASDAISAPRHCALTYKTGLEGIPRDIGYGENSWLSSIIVLMLIILAINFDNCRRLLASFPQEMFGIRRRSNAFDEHTSNESRTFGIIILLLCLNEGILVFSGINIINPIPDSWSVFSLTMMFSGVALGFYLAQIVIYRLIGFTFTDSIGSLQWIRGFNASQGSLAFMLLIPALISLFYPSAAPAMVIIGISFYFVARNVFIYKGFRIFYHNFPSLLYFILYLCSMEITPILILCRFAAELPVSQ